MVNYYNILKRCVIPDYKNPNVTAIAPVMEQKINEKTLEDCEMQAFYPFLIEFTSISINLLVNANEEGTEWKELGYAMIKGTGSFKKESEREDFTNLLENNGIDPKEVKEFVRALERYSMELKSIKTDNYDFKQVLHENPTDAKALYRMATNMMQNHNIQGVNKNGQSAYYYEVQDEEGNFTIEPIDKFIFKDLVLLDYELSLGVSESKRSLESLPTQAKEQKHLWAFKNFQYLDTTDYEVKDDFNPHPLTDRVFKSTDGEMLEYNPNVEIGGKNQTLMEKTYREILIPKNNPTDERFFNETLYLIGASLIQNNIEKILPFWFNPLGDNGKSLISKTIKMLGRNTVRELKVDNLDDKFLDKTLDNSNFIIVDEIMDTSFNGKWHILKRYTSGGYQIMNVREMYKDEAMDSNGIGTIFIFTNELPLFPREQAILERVHLIKLPNRFIAPKKDKNGNELPLDLGENEYKKDKHLSEKLAKDKESLEWLVNASIHMYKTYPFEKTSNEEIDNILFENDTIKKYLYQNYEVDEQSLISNSEIVEKLWEIPKIKRGYSKDSLSKSIGLKIKEVFGEGLRIDNTDKAIYRLKEKRNKENL